eukprot:2426889-Rhodomonas_salina.5
MEDLLVLDEAPNAPPLSNGLPQISPRPDSPAARFTRRSKLAAADHMYALTLQHEYNLTSHSGRQSSG